MRNLTIGLIAAMVLSFVALPAQSAIIGELGVLDDSANGGLNPATGSAWQVGDTYHLAFVTSTKSYPATSTDIADYNAHVTSVANNAGLGGDWFVIGSTATVDARDNTNTNPNTETGVGIFQTDGVTKIVDNNADLWDGSLDAAVTRGEDGTVLADMRPVTGSNTDGTSLGPGGRVLGGSSEEPPKVRIGRSTTTSYNWFKVYNTAAANDAAFYAMSDTLTVSGIPEPVSLMLLGLGGLGFMLRRRGRK